jgi:hypothetical protein
LGRSIPIQTKTIGKSSDEKKAAKGCGLSFLRKLADADGPPDLEQYEDASGQRDAKMVPANWLKS